MNDEEKLAFFTEAVLWMPYIYWRKMALAHYEFMEEFLNV